MKSRHSLPITAAIGCLDVRHAHSDALTCASRRQAGRPKITQDAVRSRKRWLVVTGCDAARIQHRRAGRPARRGDPAVVLGATDMRDANAGATGQPMSPLTGARQPAPGDVNQTCAAATRSWTVAARVDKVIIPPQMSCCEHEPAGGL